MSNNVKKLAVFVEGLTEQLFVNELLLEVIDGKNINIDLVRPKKKKQGQWSKDYPNLG